jgi:hypothetical protein
MRIIVQKRRMHTFDSHCSCRVWKKRMTIFGIQGRNPFGLRPTIIGNDVFPKSKIHKFWVVFPIPKKSNVPKITLFGYYIHML